MTTTAEPRMLHRPPAFSRDRMVQAWLLVKALSDAGDAIFTIAFAWTAVQIASPAIAGLVIAAGTLPRAIVLLIGGAYADRGDARRLMIVFNAIRVGVLVTVAIWCLATPPTVALLLIASIAFGLCDAFFEPAAGTMPRQLVAPSDLPAYSALSQTLSRLGTMAGSAAGGFLVALFGIVGSAGVNTLTYTVVIVFIVLWLRPRFSLPRASSEQSVLRGVADGFRHLRTERATRTLVIALSGLNLAVGPAISIGIPLQATQRGWGAGAVGIFEALVGGGAMIGALIVVRWRPRHEARGAFLALIVQGAGIVALGIGSPFVVGAGSFVIGVTAGFASALLGATFAATAAPDFLGRLGSILRLGDDCLMPVAMAAFGAIAGLLPLWVPFALYGGAMALLMTVPLSNRAFRTMSLRREDAETSDAESEDAQPVNP
ncbi:MFS transporter [Microbacterium sp. CIAB417]|uniref:MFS transporter n=1 Tax=Microbacterium sp. CIAB417 TaxID=2860287 RepID=UPI001FAC9BFA|nr:MFS transporter [Microbacterium sp. CIAB417]